MTLINQAKEFELLNKSLTPVEEPIKTGLKLPGDIVLGDFAFNTVDEYGIIWVVTDITGWWNSPSPDMPSIERGYGDGSYDVQGRYSARDLTIEGVFLAKDPSLVEAARDRLIEATDLVYKGVWLKTGTDPVRASFVRLSGGVDIQTENARGRTKFSIGLRAADPIKYEWNDSEPDGYTIVEIPAKNLTTGASGKETIDNIGNYKVPIYIEVIGPIISPATIFNKTTQELILVVSGIRGRTGAIIDNKELTLIESNLRDIATLTTRTAHNFKSGDQVLIQGVDETFDGNYLISSIPSSTTFNYEIENVSDKFSISKKSLFNDVATLETSEAHTFQVNNLIFIFNVDNVFNGTYKINSKTVNTFSFVRTRLLDRQISGVSMISNQVNVITVDPHEFVIGEQVTISDINQNFNGTFEITSIFSPTTFTYSATRTNARAVTNRSLAINTATITLDASHGFVVGESVLISGVSNAFDGVYSILSTPSATTFTYLQLRETSKKVLIKQRASNIAILTTSTAHSLSEGEQIVITNVEGFNGTFTVLAILSSNAFSYANNGANLSPTSVQDGDLRVSKRKITKRKRSGGIATLTTATAHGLLLNERVNIEGINSTYNGSNKVVLSIPTSNTFTYQIAAGTEAEVDSSGLVLITGNIPALGGSDTPTGTATVAGSLPFASVTGNAKINNYIGLPILIDGLVTSVTPLNSGGISVKKNEVPFTPGVSINPESFATATYGPDLLEIDTLNREVFLNGEIEGARAKIDILADFISLNPRENVIEFEDSGNSSSDALLKIYYRSGWLG